MAKEKTKTPAILHISAKCSDLCWARLEDKDGNELKIHDGYVPAMMPGQFAGEKEDSHYGDYVILSIDLNTGKLLNWEKPSKKTLDTFIKTGK